ncbi:protocatechuate 3,4-dioxygenase [Altericroceibacterium endophyticum]|uniref:Protocatechuate 3,4-dioxygenase n=1 Tax=Altericroceibacterium endophyticum TaxID=1808508 RepID=A0A6I4TAR4_9SPHN|nr:protocatechuate 3,4-dioxygenase [Altericroceibacterium endophyticum]MXO66845.1 protocatechuate 3,4-dioxygenase [Altericroceibacterium endophyticum]
MGEIVLGMWTSHGPTLSTDPEQWTLRVTADKKRQHPFRGGIYDFDSLVSLRADEELAEKCALDARKQRHAGCQAAIAEMAERFAAAKPDVAIIMGNDQRELFLDDVTPAITVFMGDTIWDQPASPQQAARMPPGIHEAEWGHSPPERREYPACPELAEHLVKSVVSEGFDVAVSRKLPEPPGHWSSGVPHAFGFIYRQIMRDSVIPNVPVIFNTFFPPNQPTAARCFAFGQAVGRALKSTFKDKRIAVFGSGGMSHFVIDEQLDERIFDALRNRDQRALASIDEALLQSGSSELKTWIAAAGVLFDSGLKGDVVGYEPCYRSEAGTGTANGFVAWQ